MSTPGQPVFGPQEATTADTLAAFARLDAVVAHGGDWGPALEDAETTSLADYRAALREAQASEPEAGL